MLKDRFIEILQQDFGMFFFGVANAGARASVCSSHPSTKTRRTTWQDMTRYDKMQVKVDGIGTLTVATFLALIVTGSVFGVWNFPDFSYLHADLHAIRYADTLMHDMHESDMASDTISLCILSILWEFVMWHFEVVCEWRSWKYFSSRGRHLFFTMIFGHARISHFL